MIKALIDTNITVDVALERSPFDKDAKIIYEKIDHKELQGYISASTITDIFYVIRKKIGKEMALQYLQDLLEVVDILPVNKDTIHAALVSGWSDFEDAVQAQVALENGIDVIVTRDIKDYKKAGSIKILPPPDFIRYVDSLR
jgi:predicted nucleic acid-binding protein